MKVFSANIQDLRTLYISNLKKALDMEQKITKALPDLIAKSSDLRTDYGFSNSPGRNRRTRHRGRRSAATQYRRKQD